MNRRRTAPHHEPQNRRPPLPQPLSSRGGEGSESRQGSWPQCANVASGDSHPGPLPIGWGEGEANEVHRNMIHRGFVGCRVHGFNARTWLRGILTPALSPSDGEREKQTKSTET